MSDEERRRFGPPPEDAPAVSETFSWSPEGGAAEAAPAADAWPVESPALKPTAGEDDGPKVGFLAEMIGYKRRELRAARLRKLDRAIEADPDAPVNYVLRGELRLKLRQRDEAVADFQKALALADSAFTSSDWGLVAQALSDRALAGLRRAGYRLRPIER